MKKPVRKRPVLGVKRKTRPVLGVKSKTHPVTKEEVQTLVSAIDTRTSRPALYCAVTGEFVRFADTPLKTVEPYNKDKVEAFLTLVGQGKSINTALAEVKVSKASYLHWRRKNPEFTGLINTAKAHRAEQIHEVFYDQDMRWMAENMKDYDNLPAAELEQHELISKNIERKQKIIDRYNEKSAPNVFGKNAVTTEEHAALSIKVSANIPDKYYDLIKSAFTPTLEDDGEFKVKGFDHGKYLEQGNAGAKTKKQAKTVDKSA